MLEAPNGKERVGVRTNIEGQKNGTRVKSALDTYSLRLEEFDTVKEDR